MVTRYQLLFLLMALISPLIFPEAAAVPIVVKGEVGGNISINCPSIANSTIQFFYFQKQKGAPDQQFVNGFYTGKPIKKYWPNTELDPKKTTVHMFDLRVRHNGRYICQIEYKDHRRGETFVDIEVTANYSKPNVTSTSRSDSNHSVTCESRGGYPQSKLQWSVSEDGALDENTTNATPDLNGLFLLSTTATVNCSQGELSVSCMVNGLTSERVRVCKSAEALKIPPWAIVLLVITVSVVVVVMAVAVAVGLVRRGSDSGVRHAGDKRNCSLHNAVEYTSANGQDPTRSVEEVTV